MRAVLLGLCIVLWGGGEMIRAQGPSKCCLKPDMCSFVTGSLVGYVQGSGSQYGSYSELVGIVADFPKSRFVLNITTIINGNTSTTIIIEKFQENIQWVINPLAKTCQKMAIPEGTVTINRCIPDDAQFDGQVTIAGDKLCNTWSFPLKTKSLDGMFTSTTTADKCIPVAESFVGTHTEAGTTTDLVEGSGYFNFKALDDVSKYFVLPPYCPKFQDPLSPMKTKMSDDVKRIKRARCFL